MHHILVPTDFSTCAGYAEDLAVEIAKKSKAEVVFMNGLTVGVDWVSLPKDKETRYPEIKAQIGHAEQALDERVKNASKQGVFAAKSVAFLEGYRSIANAYNGKDDL
ncbi:MAG: universal stress protein, partial [Bacteroidota bacterium]